MFIAPNGNINNFIDFIYTELEKQRFVTDNGYKYIYFKPTIINYKQRYWQNSPKLI